MPTQLKSLGEYAFAGCSALEEITFPDGLSYISPSAYERCRSLEKITIPDSVDVLTEGAFSYCSNLGEIKFGNKCTFTISDNNVQITSDAFLHGDVNGDGTISAIDVFRLLVGMKTGESRPQLDLNRDGKITSIDKLALYKIIKCVYDYGL